MRHRIAGFALLSIVATAANWPQWRGPQRDAISPETKLLWQLRDLGDGYVT